MNVNVPNPGPASNAAPVLEWPPAELTRIPYWIYQSPDIYAQEQKRVYEGPTWNFLCLEAEVAKPGDYRVTCVGTMPVIVARDYDDEIYAFENRCAHRGALIALDGGGNARDFTCVYHAWNYDLKGNLKAVAFEDGVNGKGGMGKTFCRSDHGPRKLRIAVFAGLVFGSLSDDVPPITRPSSTRSSRHSGSTACRSAAAWWYHPTAAITRASRSRIRRTRRRTTTPRWDYARRSRALR
jgi:anthranilate 1,2-dioxygenase large subunit/terephthalate 1,2-dioxygenase oxygenase component alpha subunit